MVGDPSLILICRATLAVFWMVVESVCRRQNIVLLYDKEHAGEIHVFSFDVGRFFAGD
jgi:hypothetical protein